VSNTCNSLCHVLENHHIFWGQRGDLGIGGQEKQESRVQVVQDFLQTRSKSAFAATLNSFELPDSMDHTTLPSFR